NGGAGGNTTGGPGLSGSSNIPSYGGQGGTQAAGGAGASVGGAAGTLGIGGGNGYYGGGGGGGYYGGGAGYYGGGGGGGSSYTVGTATAVTHTQGFNAGNGQIIITYTIISCASNLASFTVNVNGPAAPTVSGTTTINCGSTTTLTSSTGNNTFWYSAAVGGNLLGTGSTYTTPSLSANTSVFAFAANITSGSQSFTYTGSQQTWTVPAGVTSITVDAQGAQGGTSGYGTGGLGGRLQATLPVTPGATLFINVGGQGNTSVGGWNGGGAPYACGCAAGGGGATDIRIGGTALTDRKIVAGGGGGAGYYWNWLNDHGGVGGGLTGGAGYTNNSLNASYCGQGGTQASGGAGAAIGGPAGTLGTGGGNGYYAGGGGGGYFGGGAGYYGGGGGGGSSFSDATASAVTHTQGFKTGNGLITISWSSPSCFSNAVTTNITVNPLASPTANPATIGCGLTATLNAVGGGGSYTWYSNSNATGQLGTGASYTTPNLSANTTYYVASTSGLANGTVYTFTNCSATGMYGPTQAQVNSAYTSTNLSGAVTSSSGIQLWTVPTTGMYRIEAFGAQGGGNNNFGRGAQMRGDFNLTAGQQLKIIVGQQGGVQSSGSGGGGSFVATSANVPLIVAGGGGGQYDGGSAIANAHAVTTNNGQNSTCTSGGVAGAGGNGCGSGAAGGGGFNTNGGNGSWGTGGISFVNGGNGGNHSSYAQCVGGFGGGGGTHGNTGGGAGGGGYSGGAGETQTSLAGSGGGSYNNGSNQVNVGGIRTGNGLVTITSLTSPCASATVPVTVTIAPLSAPTVNGTTVNCGQTPTLTASNNLGGIIWYSNAAGSTQVGTGGSFTTPSLGATTTYYVGAGTGACATALTPVTVTVNPPANTTASASLANVNCGQTSVLTAQGGNIYTWYSNAAGTTIVGTGASFTTPALTANTTYYVGSSIVQSSGSQTFNYTGAQQTWTVPAGVTSITVDAQGAQGGTSGYGNGGNGGRLQATLPVTAGATLYINVGGQGNSSVGGWNGGGAPYACGCAAGGGGASDIRIGGTALTDRKIVAGGGGGAGYYWNWLNDQGGLGGGLTGGAGYTNNSLNPTYCGQGGTQAAGGAGATQGGAAGTLGTGGGNGYYAGGGGGGYYGGGAGYAGGGGGGGSSFSDATATAVTHTQGFTTGNGLISISWTISGCVTNLVSVPITVNLPAAPSANGVTVNCGQTATVTAAGGGGNTYTWYSNAAASTQVGTGASFTSPSLSATTTYYVTSGNGAANGNVYTFTNAGSTGRTGPTQAQINAAYTSTSLAGQVTINTQGIQEWIVPTTGLYTILANGAQGGGNGGLGARMQGQFSLTAGQKLFIVVGQQGNGPADGGACGGGGGSYVSTGNSTYTTSTALIVAGGGGGQSPQVGQPGLITTNGGQGESCQVGGVNGNGGADASACGSGAGGAGGFLTNGASGGGYGSQYGSGFISGASLGGTSSSGSREGGFGGGAGTHNNNTGGGAGGGYSGGSASYHGSNYEGGGGGSYNGGTNQVNTQGIQSGHGQVVITSLTTPCASSPVPVTITVNPLTTPTANPATIGCGLTATLNAVGGGGSYTWYS
ncbi:MAG: glycine-rich protein, partial [Bacteroidota bacterium]